MTDHPIIFSAPMISALLAGRKTMTRRLAVNRWQRVKPGDRLWVRETFVIEDNAECRHMSKLPTDGRPIKLFEGGPDIGDSDLIPHYRATEPEPHIVTDDQINDGDDRTRWRSPIHMPRWASRLTLVVTATRIERVQEISDNDALAEGVTGRHYQTARGQSLFGYSMNWPKNDEDCEDIDLKTPRLAFGHFLCVMHNGPRWNLKPENVWDTNPEVVALTFTVHQCNIDAMPKNPNYPVDTTMSKFSMAAAPAKADAGAPELTPKMLRAGAEAVAACLDESSSSFCELVATAAFLAMRSAQDR